MNDRWVLLNSTFLKEQEATIPISDRGFLFGEGIFTTVRLNNGKCEFLDAHIQRLISQAKELKFSWQPFSIDSIEELIKRNQAQQGTWRLKIIVTADQKGSRLQTGNVIVTLEEVEDLSFLPCTITVFPHQLASPLSHIKNLSYLDHLYVREYGRQRGCVDAITQTIEGYVLETGCSNLFWMDQETYWLPDQQLPYLKGVFLQSLLPSLPFPVKWVRKKIEEIPSSASVYICNSLHHIRPVISIEGVYYARSEYRNDLLRQATDRALRGNQ